MSRQIWAEPEEAQEAIPSKEDSQKAIIDDLPQEDTIINPTVKARKPNDCATISSVVKCMLGSVVLLLPTNFGKYGMGISIIVMVLIALVCWKTACWLVLHTLDEEVDMAQPVQRILGIAWKYVFLVGSIADIFLVVIIYFNLLATTMYPLINAILVLSGIPETKIPTALEIRWDYWSLQYMAILLMLVIYPLMLIRDISKMVKMGVFGFAALVGYVIFIIYIFIENLVMKRADAIIPGTTETYWDRYEWFLRTGDYSETVAVLTGNFALAFATHNVIAQVMQNNVRQERNVMCVSVGYLIGFLFYASIGVLGSLGVLGRNQQFDETRIMDYFTATAWEPIIVEVLFSLHMFTSIPIYNNVPKIQALILQESCFKKNETPERKKKYALILEILYTTSCAITSLACSIWLIDINMVIGLAGAVAGYILVYLCPIFMHYYCVKSKKAIMDATKESEEDYTALASQVRTIIQREKLQLESQQAKEAVQLDTEEIIDINQEAETSREQEHKSRINEPEQRLETEEGYENEERQDDEVNKNDNIEKESLDERLESVLSPAQWEVYQSLYFKCKHERLTYKDRNWGARLALMIIFIIFGGGLAILQVVALFLPT